MGIYNKTDSDAHTELHHDGTPYKFEYYILIQKSYMYDPTSDELSE